MGCLPTSLEFSYPLDVEDNSIHYQVEVLKLEQLVSNSCILFSFKLGRGSSTEHSKWYTYVGFWISEFGTSYAYIKGGRCSLIWWWVALAIGLNTLPTILKMIDPCKGQHPQVWKFASRIKTQVHHSLSNQNEIEQDLHLILGTLNNLHAKCTPPTHTQDMKQLHGGVSLHGHLQKGKVTLTYAMPTLGPIIAP